MPTSPNPGRTNVGDDLFVLELDLDYDGSHLLEVCATLEGAKAAAVTNQEREYGHMSPKRQLRWQHVTPAAPGRPYWRGRQGGDRPSYLIVATELRP